MNFTKVPTADSRVGFRTDLWFGKAADLTAAFEPAADGKEIYKHVQQAYVSLLTGKVQWDAGKFVTPIGAEVIESQDNWNYTRSILFGYAIPFYHLGVRATLPVNDKLSPRRLPRERLEQRERDRRRTRRSHLAATAEADGERDLDRQLHGRQGGGRARTPGTSSTRPSPSPPPRSSASWPTSTTARRATWSGGGSPPTRSYQATPTWALVGRYEYLDDTDGGFMTIGTKAQTVTVTSDHTIAGALKARLEYRTDFATRRSSGSTTARRRSPRRRSPSGSSTPSGGASEAQRPKAYT